MILGPCFVAVLFAIGINGLSPADVTYVEGNAPDDLKAGPGKYFAVNTGSNSASVQTKGFSANYNADQSGQEQQQVEVASVSNVRSNVPPQPLSEKYTNVVYTTTTPRSDRVTYYSTTPSSTSEKVSYYTSTAAPTSERVSYVTSQAPQQQRAYYTSSSSPTNNRVAYYSSTGAPKSEKVVYYSTPAPKTQRVIYDSTLESGPRNRKVIAYSSTPRSQNYEATYSSTQRPQNYEAVYSSTPSYQNYETVYASSPRSQNYEFQRVQNYEPGYQRIENSQVPYQRTQNYQVNYDQPVRTEFRVSQDFPRNQEISYVRKSAAVVSTELPRVQLVSSTPATPININPKATIQVPYVTSERQIQAHSTPGDSEDIEYVDQQQPVEVPQAAPKEVNIVTPVVKKTTYEIRKPAIEKQFFDIEERVIVRPAGTVVVELDNETSKINKGETITDVGKGQIVPSSTPSSGQDDDGGVSYAPSSTIRPEISNNGDTGYSTTSSSTPSPDYYDGDDNRELLVDDNGEQYVSTTPRPIPEDRDLISPHMISVGDPDFNEPPYVENARDQPSGNYYLGTQNQYVPVYNQNLQSAQKPNSKQFAYNPSGAACEQQTPYVQQQGYGGPVYTYVALRPGTSFRTYDTRNSPPATKLPPPPAEGEVEEIDVNKEEFQKPRGNYQQYSQQKSGRLTTETENIQTYKEGSNEKLNTTGLVGPGERIISATPAPPGSKPASQTVQTRRIVVNHPFETVRVVEEEEQQAKVQQVTVNQQSAPSARYRNNQRVSSRFIQAPGVSYAYRQPVYTQRQIYNGYLPAISTAPVYSYGYRK